MYEKSKLNMKILAIALIIALASMTSSQPVEKQTSVIDEDFFKKELQQSVLEFCEDLGVDPDSVYMPFRDEL